MDANNIQSIKAYIKQFENLQDYKIGQDCSKFEVDTAQTLCANKYKSGNKKKIVSPEKELRKKAVIYYIKLALKENSQLYQIIKYVAYINI